MSLPIILAARVSRPTVLGRSLCTCCPAGAVTMSGRHGLVSPLSAASAVGPASMLGAEPPAPVDPDPPIEVPPWPPVPFDDPPAPVETASPALPVLVALPAVPDVTSPADPDGVPAGAWLEDEQAQSSTAPRETHDAKRKDVSIGGSPAHAVAG